MKIENYSSKARRKIENFLYTVVHLKPRQVVYQVWRRLYKPSLKRVEAPAFQLLEGFVAPIPKYRCCEGNKMTFLNITDTFSSWNETKHGMLWAYNLNYFDWLGQEGMSGEDGIKWIDKFIKEVMGERLEKNNMEAAATLTANRSTLNSLSMDPYPIALRSINWIKFLTLHPEYQTKSRLDALYSQVLLLRRKLEYHLLGNHLLEDAYALFMAAVFFQDQRLFRFASCFLRKQLEEQILPDGAHYEQSPMYHCILLERLLDCINLVRSSIFNFQFLIFNFQFSIFNFQLLYASRMLGHLESIVWSDGSIPLLNDSAYGIAPTPKQLFDYARRLEIKWEPLAMQECGYRKMTSTRMEAIVDIGNITATYQSGHTHADTFNYVLNIDGKPFVVDTGISTYNKTARRQYERSTAAHNTVGVGECDSSRVWGGFRVGRRCHTEITEITDDMIVARHNGFEKPCYRTFRMDSEAFVVEDRYDGEAISYVHLAEGTDANRLKVSGDGLIDIQTKPCEYSTEYNQFHNGTVLEITFRGHVRYTIS